MHTLDVDNSWAIKEAAYKSLYPILPILQTQVPDQRLSFHSFDLDHIKTAPMLRLLQCDFNGTNGEEVLGIRFICSVSHDAGIVVAVVVAIDDGIMTHEPSRSFKPPSWL